jgi:hypothetical protein
MRATSPRRPLRSNAAAWITPCARIGPSTIGLAAPGMTLRYTVDGSLPGRTWLTRTPSGSTSKPGGAMR